MDVELSTAELMQDDFTVLNALHTFVRDALASGGKKVNADAAAMFKQWLRSLAAGELVPRPRAAEIENELLIALDDERRRRGLALAELGKQLADIDMLDLGGEG